MKTKVAPKKFYVLPRSSPFVRAATMAGLYAALCAIYIAFSTWIAANSAKTPQEMQVIETAKGIAFVLATALLFFLAAFVWWRRIKRREDLLIQLERKAVASMYNATLAHDLSNLLMSLYGLVEELETREAGDAFLSSMRTQLERSIGNLANLAKRLAATAVASPSERVAPMPLALEIPRILGLVRKHPDLQGVALVVRDIPRVVLRLDREYFGQALMNLVLNAAQATGRSGKIEVVFELQDKSLVVEVHDSGPGVTPEISEAIFDPGFTTKAEGTGLGLFSVRAFAVSCRGEVSVERSPTLGGALFRLRIPLGNEIGSA
jgi:two-component system sensor histidine kinase HydH